jgi:non-haem Fe2+, alpha-ketoglutarate-dependent halogenase
MRRVVSPEQRRRYEHDGFLLPFTVLEAAEVAAFHRDYEELEPHLGDRPPRVRSAQCHLHFRWAFELATHPRVLDAVEDLIGPDILVHSSNIFCKQPHDPAFVSWHQDAHRWGLDTPRLVTAWVALTDSTAENGCMRVVPGTHRERLPHNARPGGDSMLKTAALDSNEIDESRAVDLVLQAGQMSLHHADLVHGSRPNGSDGKRIGVAVRYVSPAVKQESWHHAVVLARGNDAHGHYELLERPPSSDLKEGLAAHAAFWEELVVHAERPELGQAQGT